MKDWQTLINSGLLELYVLGQTDDLENAKVERMSAAHQEVRDELDRIERALEQYAFDHSVEPDPIVAPLLFATIDFTDRMKAGEEMRVAPMLSAQSAASDYQQWLDREDMVLPEDSEDVFAKIISVTPEAMTAIAWIKYMAPQEVHDDQYERFLILEGTCTILVEQDAYPLKAGDYFEIPLHKRHELTVTSSLPCKAILQRVTA